MSETPEDKTTKGWGRAGINLGAFLIAFVFVWVVFDNLALALIFALLFAGGGEAAQRFKRSREKTN
jgi:hypothetical protein